MATENDFITPDGLLVYETANVVGNTTSSDMYASLTNSLAQPSVSFDFYKSKRLDSRINFTRASTGSYYNSKGVLSYAAVNEPRFDYDPVTGVSKGFLIEEARTNLITYSEQFDISPWVISSDCTIIPNLTTTSPDGKLSAYLFTANLGNGDLRQEIAINTNKIYTASTFIKAGSATSIYFRDQQTDVHIIIDMSTFTVTSTAGTLLSYGVVSVGNGWYRVFMTYNSTTTLALLTVRTNGAGSLYVWGVQLEVGPGATSYIPTIASTVTRTQDVTLIKDDNFSSWYTANCVVYVEASGTNISAPPYSIIFSLDNDDSTNYITLFYYGGSPNLGNISVRTTDGVTYNEAAINAGTVVNDTFCKIAVLINNQPGNTSNYITGYVNGVGTTFTNSALPTDITRLRIGTYRYDQQLNGHIKKIAFYQLTGTNATANSLMAMTL